MAALESLGRVVPLGVAVVLLAAIFRLVPGARRRRLRRSVIFYAMYLVLIGLWLLSQRIAPFRPVSVGLRYAFELFELLVVIDLAALALFDLLLPAVHFDLPDILHDLTVGAVYLIATAWSMHRWGVNLTSIVATSAVATAVIGLSLQSTLGNVIGGLALQVDDSIREGDWVELESKTQGQVKKVRWRHTVIETRDWDTLIVPNSRLLSEIIKILGKREGQAVQHRMWVPFNVDHRFAPGHVIKVVNDALGSAPILGVSSAPEPQAICTDLARQHGDSYCCYAVRYFLTDLASDDPTNSLIRERIHAALRRSGIPLALPAQALFLSQEDSKSEQRLRKVQTGIRESLRGVELFARLSDEELSLLAESANFAPFVRGEVVTRQNATAHFLYVLVKGEVEVRVATEGGGERRVASLSAPAFFGEMALMTGAPREATVVAQTDIECLRVDKNDFREVLARRAEVAQEISTILARRRVELEAVRDNLDAESKQLRVQTERGRILASIREFFALEEKS